MSYTRAWSLIRTMNACFRLPVIESVRGGATQGGTRLTSEGKAILDLYRQMEAASQRASQPAWERLQIYFKK